jgi:endonuclease/exonuclease/phosphatase family metal-dependent hydrolase
MRIGTWNVEYGAGLDKNVRRLRRIREMDCDVWVLTETHDDLDLGSSHTSVSTTHRASGRVGARWTTIWSRFPITRALDVDDPNRTAAVLLETPLGALVVYGTVLPWQSDPGPSGDARGWTEHHRVIPEQAREWASLRAAHPEASLCLAGDLNMNLGGPHYYGTAKGRGMLRAGLEAADLVCVTDADRVPGGWLVHGPIDHICVSATLAAGARVAAAWEGVDGEGVHLSDHSGLVVETRAE